MGEGEVTIFVDVLALAVGMFVLFLLHTVRARSLGLLGQPWGGGGIWGLS